MNTATEVRWHGRGGQGTVTAAKILAETALGGGKHVQAFPEYGPERMGAPLRAYNRISAEPIQIHCMVTNPDIVVVVDPTLIKGANIVDGTDEKAIFVLNTTDTPETIKQQLGLKTQKVYTVDATKISIDTIGRSMPNTPMLGALAKATGIVSLDELIDHVKHGFGKKFNEKVLSSNLAAIKQAYEQVVSE